MATTGFQRARSEQQREQRRAAILDASAGMLAEGVLIGDLTLNELARRVGLAKSNVLRYFESREAVLLTLLDLEYGAWLDAVESRFATEGLPTRTDGPTRPSVPAAPIDVAERVAEALTDEVVAHPMLSELLANAQVVLEQNVSAEVAAQYKRRAASGAMRLVGLVESQVGALPDPSRLALAGGVNLVIGGVWGQCRPSAGMAAAYERYPELAALRLDQRAALRELLATLLVGLLTRPARA